MTEEWRPVPGFAGFYEISNLGNIRSVTRYVNSYGGRRRLFAGQALAPGKDKDGYRIVVLHKYGEKRTFRVCGLVAEAFIGPRPLGLMVLHGNATRDDDRVTNLRYGTHAENMLDKERDGNTPRGESHVQHKHPDSVMLAALRDAKQIGISAAARLHGIGRTALQAVKSGQNRRYLLTQI